MSATTTGVGLEQHGIEPEGEVIHNPTTSQLYADALERGDGGWPRVAAVVDTGQFTGRSPKDKFVVREPSSEERIWWERHQRPDRGGQFDGLRQKVVDHLATQPRLYVIDAFAGADPAHRIGVRVVAASPYTALFAKTMFIRPTEEELDGHEPGRSSCTPRVEADPAVDGPGTGVFIVLHPSRSEVVIGGTFYAGEIKKSIFTVMNDRLPARGRLPDALLGERPGRRRRRDLLRPLRHGQDDALGRSRAQPDRRRRARLGKQRRLQRRGRVLREGDPPLGRGRARDPPHDAHLRDDPRERDGRRAGPRRSRRRLEAENTGGLRGSSRSRTPIPPRWRATRATSCSSRRTRSAACRRSPAPLARRGQYWFLSGFTAKLAGTEIGVTEPQPTFSTCFGQPFIPQLPSVYASMLADRLEEHGATVWLVNTGWTGGPFGEGTACRSMRRAHCSRPRSPAASTTRSTASTPS